MDTRTNTHTQTVQTSIFFQHSLSTSNQLLLILTRLTARCCHGDTLPVAKGSLEFRGLWTQLKTIAAQFLAVRQGAAGAAASTHNYPLGNGEYFHSFRCDSIWLILGQSNAPFCSCCYERSRKTPVELKKKKEAYFIMTLFSNSSLHFMLLCSMLFILGR